MPDRDNNLSIKYLLFDGYIELQVVEKGAVVSNKKNFSFWPRDKLYKLNEGSAQHSAIQEG